MHSFSKLLVSLAALSGLTRAGLACDSCAIYLAEGTDRPGFTAVVAEQFTHYGTMWQGATELSNPVGQYLDSSITQLTAAYSQGGAWQVQFTLPYIHRSYLRPDHAEIERGTVNGIGDSTLAAHYRLWRKVTPTDTFDFGVVGGIEFGTGDATHLGDELGEEPHHHEEFPESGIHGHDLALGSGSTDYLLGADAEWQHGRFFVRGSLQYLLRRPGAFGYRLADETSWEIGPGGFVLLTHEHSLAIQAVFANQHKGLDTLGGEPQTDTGFSANYLGGRLTGTVGDRFSAEIAAEWPTRLRTSDTMIVPDYRIRAAATWRF